MTRELLADGNCLNRIFDHSLPAHKRSHGTHDDVTDFFAVDDDLHVAGEQLLEFFKKSTSPFVDLFVVLVVVGPMLVVDVEFVVVVQVVRGRNDADQATEMVFPDPDDLFLAPDSAMVIAISPGAFTYG